MSGRIAVVLLLVASCKKDPCEQAGNHMFGAISKHAQAWLSLEPGEVEQAKASVIEDCKMRPWDEGASGCIGRAIDAKDLEACAEMDNIKTWRGLVLDQVDPNGTKRYPELDALVAEVLAADKAVGAEPGECTTAVPVVAFDRTIIKSLAANKALPTRASYVGPSFTDALTRYVARQKVSPHEVLGLRKWIKSLPKDRAWGIVETDSRVEPAAAGAKSFIVGEYTGRIHVVRGDKRLCERVFAARSSESVKTYFVGDKPVLGIEDQLQTDLKGNIDDALETRIVKLQRGEPDPSATVAPFRAELIAPKTTWHCTVAEHVPTLSHCSTDAKGCKASHEVGGGYYGACTKYDQVTCVSYRAKDEPEPTISCHTSAESCAATRAAVVGLDSISEVSRCTSVP